MNVVLQRAAVTFAITATTLVAAWAFFTYVLTPTTEVDILNDTSQELTVSGCGSDPATLKPGQSVIMDPDWMDPRAACTVTFHDTTDYLGCLPIPTTEYSNGMTVQLSRYRPQPEAEPCGD